MSGWDDEVLALQGDAHFMQSEAWAATKQATPWALSRIAADASPLPVQLFTRRVPAFGSLVHAPRVAGVRAEHVPELTRALRQAASRGAFAVKLEFFQHDDDALFAAFEENGWMRTLASQYRHAVSLDITGSEDEVLGRFKKRARYEVRAAERGGVEVKRVPLTSENVDTMVSLVNTTKDRTGAFFRHRGYLERAWRAFAERGQGDLYFASHEGEILAGAFVFSFGRTAWYKDGGSVRSKPKLMAPRFLQWEIMRDLRARGIERYELGNIPDPDAVEGSSTAGLFRFKTGFSDETVRYLPAVELPLKDRQGFWHTQEKNWLRVYSRARRDYWY
ncbi:peptidoglycan bridge formation glycyltransferase FemA/FemB family protein [Microbacterium sp. STN6]|uniref:lipid II:glycine glycyltransferase FemX n=1 Tax=Microbacterium sp. STN6 TaxID=2995588 RepID=UPI002260F3FA|nr:peptidoglycan bridge formation glycyltransferase FemA/FemB family protein [Microbacterium sp. STN6]MCX7521182.1 peptidoglycan bridge formation glycyltransferase FemA/FemB family protein [Microbacterium sp. STN6]